MNTKIKFVIYCSICKEKLYEEDKNETLISSEEIFYQIIYPPCKKCLQRCYDAGYKRGYDWASGGRKALEGEGKEAIT